MKNLEDFEKEMTNPVQQYSEKEISEIPRIFSENEKFLEKKEESIEMEMEEEFPKPNPKRAKITAKMTFFTIDTSLQTILSIIAKSDIPGADEKEKSDLIEMWEEYYLETGKEPPLWLMLLGMNIAVYGDKVGMAIKKRKEQNDDDDNTSTILEDEPKFDFEIKRKRNEMPMNDAPSEIREEKKEMQMKDVGSGIQNEEIPIIREGFQEEVQPTKLICKNDNCENELSKKQKNFCSVKCRNEYINTKRKEK